MIYVYYITHNFGHHDEAEDIEVPDFINGGFSLPILTSKRLSNSDIEMIEKRMSNALRAENTPALDYEKAVCDYLREIDVFIEFKNQGGIKIPSFESDDP